MDDSEIDVFRRKSHYFADYAKVAQNEVSTLSRWLTASLLAVNGGGALAAGFVINRRLLAIGANSLAFVVNLSLHCSVTLANPAKLFPNATRRSKTNMI